MSSHSHLELITSRTLLNAGLPMMTKTQSLPHGAHKARGETGTLNLPQTVVLTKGGMQSLTE